jgi:hypothetical protein
MDSDQPVPIWVKVLVLPLQLVAGLAGGLLLNGAICLVAGQHLSGEALLELTACATLVSSGLAATWKAHRGRWRIWAMGIAGLALAAAVLSFMIVV